MSAIARTEEIRQLVLSGEVFGEITGFVAAWLCVGRLGGDRRSKSSEREGYRRWVRGGGSQLISACLRRPSDERFQFRGRLEAVFRSGSVFMALR